MLFGIGSRVMLVHTGDEGVVTAFLGDNMVNILLDDGDEIPASEDDIINIEDEKRLQTKKAPIKAKVVKAKQKKVIKAPERPKVEQQYSILKSMGIQIGFEPEERLDGSVAKYKVHLINDTSYDILYTFQLSLTNRPGSIQNGKLESIAAIELNELSFDQLNDGPSIELECWQITTVGTGSRLHKSLRIKPQQFFKKVKTAPILNTKVHHYIVFDSLEPNKKSDEDLKSYTQRNAKPTKKKSSNFRRVTTNDIKAYASFNTELDLHITTLTNNTKGMTSGEKLHLQLEAFEKYLSQAIELGVPQVFIIHGIGKGKLKDRIASILLQHPDVTTFKNEHHPKYGWGATEVIF